jgi:hypothetical protein
MLSMPELVQIHFCMQPMDRRPNFFSLSTPLAVRVVLESCVDLKPIKGMLLGFFGRAGNSDAPARPTHVLVVNLDFRAEKCIALVGHGRMEVFDAAARTWSAAEIDRATLHLPPGGGKLVRVAQ